jgi:hypothetical protein
MNDKQLWKLNKIIKKNRKIIEGILNDKTGKYTEQDKEIYAYPGLAKETDLAVGKVFGRGKSAICWMRGKVGIVHQLAVYQPKERTKAETTSDEVRALLLTWGVIGELAQ